MPSLAHLDLSRSLEELEGLDWGAPTYDSYLVTTCHALRKKPLREFGVEDLRIMIGQNIGLPFLLPLALEVLKKEPLAAGDYYDGDLLAAVLRSEVKQLKDWRAVASALEDIADRALKVLARNSGSSIEEVREIRSGFDRMRTLNNEKG